MCYIVGHPEFYWWNFETSQEMVITPEVFDLNITKQNFLPLKMLMLRWGVVFDKVLSRTRICWCVARQNYWFDSVCCSLAIWWHILCESCDLWIWHQVRYIDYGNSVWVSKDMVRADVNQFVDIPTQAFECVLHQLKPVSMQCSFIENLISVDGCMDIFPTSMSP